MKDVPILCDGFVCSSDKQESSEINKILKDLILLSNGGTRKEKGQNRMIICTGESLYKDIEESKTQRVLYLNFKENSENGNKLKYIQNHQKELQYTTKCYIEDIIENYEEVKEKIKTRYNEKKHEASKQITYRTSEMIATIYVGFSLFIDFAVKNGTISDEERTEMLQKGWNCLLEVGKEQNKQIEDVSPTNMIISAIELLSSTNRLYVVDMQSAPYMKTQDIFKQGFLGFYEKERNANFAYPEILYKKIRDFYRGQGIEIPFNQSAMCKDLMIKGYLYKTQKQERPQIRIKNPVKYKKEESMIGILADKIYIPCIYNENGTIREK